MPDEKKSHLETIDVAVTAAIKVLVLGVVLVFMLMLSFCSDDTVKGGSKWLTGRLELTGFKPKKLSLGILELEAAVGAETGNVQGLAAELKRLATDSGAGTVGSQLARLAADVDSYSQRLASRDEKVAATVRTVAQTPSSDSRPVAGWVYLGRLSSSGEWAPQSDKLTLDNQKKPAKLTPQKDIVLVDKDPSTQTAAGTANPSEVLRMLRAGTSPLQIQSIQTTESIGNGKLQWARVSVLPTDLYELSRQNAP